MKNLSKEDIREAMTENDAKEMYEFDKALWGGKISLEVWNKVFGCLVDSIHKRHNN